jgi:hypothetical protein
MSPPWSKIRYCGLTVFVFILLYYREVRYPISNQGNLLLTLIFKDDSLKMLKNGVYTVNPAPVGINNIKFSIRVSDYQTFGLSDGGTIEPSDYWTFGQSPFIQSYVNSNPTHIGVSRVWQVGHVLWAPLRGFSA